MSVKGCTAGEGALGNGEAPCEENALIEDIYLHVMVVIFSTEILHGALWVRAGRGFRDYLVLKSVQTSVPSTIPELQKRGLVQSHTASLMFV